MKHPFVIAGPCSAESYEQLRKTAQALSRFGVDFFRAGAWKPRTHPNDFMGHGTEALEWLSKIQEEFQLPVATEVASPAHVEAVLKVGLKGVWVGARTTVNPFAVQEIASAVAGTKLHIFVKNPINPDIALWMGALERFQRVGIDSPMAIHRGFSVYKSDGYRNTPIWMIPMDLKRCMPHIAILCDPSHISGNSDLVPSLAQKAMDLCFDGLMVEVHPHPQEALSDAQQQLTPIQFEQMMHSLVLRTPDASGSLRNKIDDLRAQINLFDDQMVSLLAQRMGIVREIGSIKREGGITIFQQRRLEELIERIRNQGDLAGVSPMLLEHIFALIHQEAVLQQQEIMQSAKNVTDSKPDAIEPIQMAPCLHEVSHCTKPNFISISQLSDILHEKRAILLVDKKVDELYSHRLPPFPKVVIEANERLKRLETVQEVIQKLMTLEVDRETWLVGIGGGIVCDIVGFVASIYMRGIPFVLVPTTLLSQVDAAIGGKNGVNADGIKNMMGCITQPQAILCDTDFLHTLPQKEIRSGLCEVIKHALIGNLNLLNYIEDRIQMILALDPEAVQYLLAESHRFKCGIVERDEREKGLRRILNFGHTVGHAIESIQQHQVEARNKNIINNLNNNTEIITTQNIEEASIAQSDENYTHGEAVAIGILYAVALSERFAHLDKSLLPRLKRLYTQCTLPTTLPCSLDDLCNAMLLDKKRTDTSIRFILLQEVGAPFQYQIPMNKVAGALKEAYVAIFNRQK